MANFDIAHMSRSKLARVWLNEEWFAEQLVQREEVS